MISTRRLLKSVLGVCLLLLLSVPLVLAAEAGPAKGKSVRKTATNDYYTPFLINNVFNYYGNNGDGSINNYRSDAEGFEFPKGSGQNVIYEDGVVWGCFQRDTLKVGGSTYNHGLQAGRILAPGTPSTPPTADNAGSAGYRVYRVRPDINPKTPFSQVQDLINNTEVPFIGRYISTSAQTIYNQYIQDWNQWPASQGAPFTDVNGDGVYDPNVDIPGRPGADQTLWYVANDLDPARVANLYSSKPIGIEMQKTIWGYNRAGALGSTIFVSTLIINKSGVELDSMFVSQWSDPDLGYAGDDFVGCDTTRSLGYVYNGLPVDKNYGVAVPAGGFEFFQGPRVVAAADSAVWLGKRIYGWKNLPMSAFYFFTQGNAKYTDPNLGAGNGGDIQFYRLLNGLVASDGSQFIDPNTGIPSKFCMPGNPLTGQGWIDGQEVGPADRRLGLVTGPFKMAPGDTQEIVVANLAGLGKDRISSISVLLWYSDLALAAYDNLFVLPTPPPQPKVTFAALDREIVLSWGDTSSATLESFTSKGYNFEGYNIYQFPAASTSNPVLLATYDKKDGITTVFDNAYDPSTGYVIKKPVEFGGDFGISHSIDLKKDAVNNTGLLNGTNYYFGVSAYSVNTAVGANPVYLESPVTILKDTLSYSTGIVPHSANPGWRLGANVGDTVAPAHTAGIADGAPLVKFVDPTRVPQGNFQIQVVVLDSVNSGGVTVANPRWQLLNKSTGKIVIPPTLDFTNGTGNPMYLGMQVGLAAVPIYKYGKELSQIVWSGPSAYNFSTVNPGSGNTGDLENTIGILVANDFFGDGILNPVDVKADVAIEFVGKGQGQNAYDFVRASTGSTGAPYEGFYPQPFNVWQLNPDGSHMRQLDFCFMEKTGSAYYDSVWSPGAASSDREYWFVILEGYTATPKAKYTGATLGGALTVDSVLLSGWHTLKDPTLPGYVAGDKWTFKTTKLLTTGDTWDFGTAAKLATYAKAAAQADVTKINVFPNPYVGFNPQEINKYARWVTFTHLPAKATIRIFTLAGVLVRTILKNDNSQMIQWDLNNTNGFPVAAGIYIAYVDMPDLGVTKTLKLGVIPEQQYLDRY
jgi:hypothetical protein